MIKVELNRVTNGSAVPIFLRGLSHSPDPWGAQRSLAIQSPRALLIAGCADKHR
jgi:hypothetical protein